MTTLDDTEKKLVSLAETMTPEQYSWRPEEGVRSVSEVLMHEAGANYLFPTFLGAKPPAGITRTMEKDVTKKPEVVAALKASFDHVRKAVEGMSEADLAKPTKMFGRDTTYAGVLFVMSTHMHEHLGQLIAYARANHVTPPWSKKDS